MHNWPGYPVGHAGREPRAGDGLGQRPSRSPCAARAATPPCRTWASIRCRWPARSSRPSQTIVSRNKQPIDTARGVGHDDPRRRGQQRGARDAATIEGTVRAFRGDVLDLIERRMRQIAEHTCAAHEARCDVRVPPPLRRRWSTTRREAVVRRRRDGAASSARPTCWCRSRRCRPEDFAYMLQAKPGCLLLHRQRRRSTTARSATAPARACCTTRATTSTTP